MKIPCTRIEGVHPHAQKYGDDVIIVITARGERHGLRFCPSVLKQFNTVALVGERLRGSRRGRPPEVPYLTNFPPLEFAPASAGGPILKPGGKLF